MAFQERTAVLVREQILAFLFSASVRSGGTSTLASVWTEQNSKREPKIDKNHQPPVFQALLFFFFPSLTPSLTLGHLKRCFGLSKDQFESVPSVRYDFFLKINERSIPALKEELLFQIWCRPPVVCVALSVLGPAVGAHHSARRCYYSM